MKLLRIAALAAATLALSALLAPASAGNTVFLTNKGNQTFPISQPPAGGAGALDNTTIGATTPQPGTFTDAASTTLKVDSGTKTATATAGAATLNKNAGVITSESLSTAAGATYTLTITDSAIAAADQVFASVQLGTATTGMPVVTTVTPAAGSVVIVVQNIHASAALNGTIKISFARLKN